MYEKVRQPKDAAELLSEMDRCGIDEAVVYCQSMIDVAPAYGNKAFLADERNYTGRLKGTLTVLPSVSDKGFEVENLLNTMKKHNLFALRANPKLNRFFLDGVTCGDLLDACVEKNIPLYLSPRDGWEHIFGVLKEFPALTVIIHNYGLWGSDRYFFPLVRAYKNVYVDTSDYQETDGIKAFVDKFGGERMLFGTNYPMDNMGGPKAMLLSSRIKPEDKENIAYRNAERLLKSVKLR